jgi:lipopolysaccharide export system permease protein
MGVAMLGGTLSRYFGMRFVSAAVMTFVGVFALVALVDSIELMRRTADVPNVSVWVVIKTSFFRVPQVTERIMPFCVLVGAMSSYLNLSRRLELVVARAAGMSAWQFVAPAVIGALLLGVAATALYNPISATLHERAQRLESEIFGRSSQAGGSMWLRQRSPDGQAIINADRSSEQGLQLAGVTVFTFDTTGRFKERIEARNARLLNGNWRLEQVRVHAAGVAPNELASSMLPTYLTPEQVRESFVTPETVSFWQLPFYIASAENAGLGAAGYRLQYQKLLARPFMLAAMVFLAAAVSLRFFRFGGVQKMVLSGVGAGFFLYVLSKVTEDMSRAELLHPMTAAWLPAVLGTVVGLVALLYQEDG